jgi:azurin
MKMKFLAGVLLSLSMVSGWAASCQIEVTGDDAMKFNVKEITVNKKCKEFTVILKHIGKMSRATMGHNWVLAKTSEINSVISEGIVAGISKDYVKPGDTRVIAATKLIGGGEVTSVTFPVSKLKMGEEYTYVCSFPGHFGIMRGKLKLVG